MIILNVSGNLTADAIVRTVNGTSLIAFTIASNNRYKTKGGKVHEEVNYIRCTIWNKPELEKLLYKGRSVNATGIFRPNIWHDENGIKQISLDMRVSFVQVFGKKKNTIVTETYSATSAPVTEEEATNIEKNLPF